MYTPSAMEQRWRARRWRAAAIALAATFAATLALAAWSRHRYASTGVKLGRPITLCIGSGLLALDNFDHYKAWELAPDPNTPLLLWPPMLSSGNRWAIWERDTRADGTPYTHWYARVPIWMPSLAVLVAALVCERRARRLYAWSPTRCTACGYDLAGLKPGPCPECGSAPSPK